MKLIKVKWVNSQSELPSKGGVYYIAPTKNLEDVLYIGQAENLQKRLRGSHNAWDKARTEYRQPWIAYELVSKEKERKLLEHLRIGELKPRYNDGGLRENAWELLSYEKILNLQNNISNNVDFEVTKVLEWLNLAWENLDNAKGLLLLERNPNGAIFSYLQKWENYQATLDDYEEWEPINFEHGLVGYCRGIRLFCMKRLDYSGWDSPIVDSLLRIQGKRIKSWTSDKSKRLSMTQKALLAVRDYLNPDFMNTWDNFLKYNNYLVKEGIYVHNQDAIIDFIDHCIAWSLALDVPYLRLLLQERVLWFNEVFLEDVYKNKHQVEDWAKCYIPSEIFVIGFHKWCADNDFIPEIIWQGEDYRVNRARVRIQE